MPLIGSEAVSHFKPVRCRHLLTIEIHSLEIVDGFELTTDAATGFRIISGERQFRP